MVLGDTDGSHGSMFSPALGETQFSIKAAQAHMLYSHILPAVGNGLLCTIVRRGASPHLSYMSHKHPHYQDYKTDLFHSELYVAYAKGSMYPTEKLPNHIHRVETHPTKKFHNILSLSGASSSLCSKQGK